MDWSHRLIDTITYRTKTGRADGDDTYSNAVEAKARVQQWERIVRGVGGQENLTTHKLWTQTDIPKDSRVWIPGANTADPNESHTVLQRAEAYTLDGSYTGYVLYLGR